MIVIHEEEEWHINHISKENFEKVQKNLPKRRVHLTGINGRAKENLFVPIKEVTLIRNNLKK